MSLKRYELLRRLATGGMAEIYLARLAGSTTTEPQLVIKRMLPDLARDPAYVEMFLAEARVTKRLAHPNIVSVSEIGEDPGNCFYAMEYVHGADLLEIVRRLSRQHKTVPIECAVAIAIGVCSALEHAHTLTDQQRRPLQIVHRDVSLANILIGYDGSVKLADFGVMRHGGRAQTEPGILKGKLGYMSPEQARGAPFDRRSDLFALGVVLYEMTTGERVFPPCERDDQTLARVIRCAITPPSDLAFDYPLDLGAIVMTALARDPDDRYASARELQRDLQAFLRVHKMSGAPHVVGALVARTFPVASPKVRKLDDTADLDALVGTLQPVAPRTISTEMLPVAPSGPMPSPPARPRAPRPRLRRPVAIAIASALAGIAVAAWMAWNESPAPEETVVAAPTPPPIPIREPAVTDEATAVIAAGERTQATVVHRDAPRALETLRSCYRSPPRARGDDIEVAFDLLDTRVTAHVGARGLHRLASCARRAAAVFGDPVVVTITFKPSS